MKISARLSRSRMEQWKVGLFFFSSMMRPVISLAMKSFKPLLAVLVMVATPVVQAHAQVISVESAMRQLSYSLNVEWDQKDPAFRKQALDRFAAQMMELKKSGISRAEVFAALQKQMPDAQMAQDLETLAHLAQEKNLSEAETEKLVMTYLQKSQTSGASWGMDAQDVLIFSGMVVVLIGVMYALVWIDQQRDAPVEDDSHNGCIPDPTIPNDGFCF